ncbi:MAG: hypothetical protein ACE5JH_00940 [Acidobacteriota bacterium]
MPARSPRRAGPLAPARASRRAIHSRIALDRAIDRDRLKAWILAEPDSLEQGFRVLEMNLGAGPAGSIDILGADSEGSLVLAILAGDDIDRSLLSLLDQYGWIREQRSLLERLYVSKGVREGRPIRTLLLAPGFTHAFLKRLSLLSIGIEPCVARPIRARDETVLAIEPARTIFGLERGPGPEAGARPEGPAPRGSVTDWALEPAPARTRDQPAAGEDPALDDLLDDLRPPPSRDGAGTRPAPLDRRPGSAPPTRPAAIGPDALEPLSAEELEEFDRFDRERRGRSPET